MRLVVTCLALVMAVGSASGAVVDQVAAEVNGEHIMLSEVRRDLKDEFAALPKTLHLLDRRRQEDVLIRLRLWRMIQERLTLQAAEREMDENQKAAIERRVETRVKALESARGSRQALLTRLAVEGRTLNQLRENLRRRITLGTYLRAKTQPGLHVTRRKVLTYYRKNRSEFVRPEHRTWRIIMISHDRFATPADARGRAEEVRKSLDAGEKFQDLVKAFSHGLRQDEGGQWGPMKRGDFGIDVVEQAVFSLRAGQVSGAIEGDTACYLVKVETVEPAVDRSFAEAQTEIRERLMAQELDRRERELSAHLQKRAFVRIYYK